MISSAPPALPTSRKWRAALVLSLGANVVFLAAFFLRGTELNQRQAANAPLRGHAPSSRPIPAPAAPPKTASALPLPAPSATIDDLPNIAESQAAPWPLLENLPREKWDQLQTIAADYGELAEKIYRRSSGLIPPEDREKLALLEKEKNADLASVLTPSELDDYQRRATDTARLHRR